MPLPLPPPLLPMLMLPPLLCRGVDIMRIVVTDAAPSAANEHGPNVGSLVLPDAEIVPETAYTPAGKATTRDPELKRCVSAS